jgi:hypothetical protein
MRPNKLLKELIRKEVRKILNESSRSAANVLPTAPWPRYSSWAKNFAEWKNEIRDSIEGTDKILDPDKEITTDKI